METQYRAELYVSTPYGGYWEVTGSVCPTEEQAKAYLERAVRLNNRHHYQNITNARVTCRTLSPWEPTDNYKEECK